MTSRAFDPYAAVHEYAQIALTRRNFAVHQPVARELIETMDVKLAQSVIDDAIGYAMMQVRGMVYGRKLVDGAVEVHTRELPATWWDMWKAGHSDAARWVRKRWPVKTRKFEFVIALDRWAHYPDLSPRLTRGGPAVIVDEVEWRVSGGL